MYVRVHVANSRASCTRSCGLSSARGPRLTGPRGRAARSCAQKQRQQPASCGALACFALLLCLALLLCFVFASARTMRAALGSPPGAASAWRIRPREGARARCTRFAERTGTCVRRTPECAREPAAQGLCGGRDRSGSPSLWLLSLGETRESDPLLRRRSGSSGSKGKKETKRKNWIPAFAGMTSLGPSAVGVKALLLKRPREKQTQRKNWIPACAGMTCKTQELDYTRLLPRALRAIRCANVRFGILPAQSRFRGNDEQ